LRQSGAPVGGRSDTEILFQCLMRWGVDETLERLDGMFAFAWYEERTDTLYLARDPMGEKPLYWSQNQSRVWFASEIKVLLASGEVSAEPNLARLDDYLYTGKVNGAASMFRDVVEVEPGAFVAWTRGSGSPSHTTYWSLSERARAAADTSDPGELAGKLGRAIASRRISDVPVGVLLSGGIDSNTLAEFLYAAHPDDALDLYFADNADPARSERSDVEAFLAHLAGRYPQAQARFHPNVIDFEDYQARMNDLTWHYDEPLQFANSPLLHGLCEMAREDGIKVLISGEGADELFFGYERFARTLAEIGAEAGGEAGTDGIIEAFYFGGGRHSTGDVERLTAGVCEGPRATEPWQWLEANIDNFPLDRLQLLFSQRYRLQTLLQRQDRIGMAASIEIRVPFLAPWFAGWVNGLPVSALYDPATGTTKKCLREVMAERLPQRILSKPKDGFPSDMLSWLREERLEAIVGEMVGEPGGFCQSYLDGAFARQLLADHFSGKRRHDVLVWELYALEVWHRQFGQGSIESAGARRQ
ncbi:MAG: asparagine synthetase B family protein, partial [Alphaproteobacteria bacterium]